MPAARQQLSARQVEVLRWIADGCPDGVMSGHTYKTTALALQNRRLAAVSKRRGGWQAVITDAGRFYLANGTYPDLPARSKPASAVTPRRPPAPRPKPAATPPSRTDGRQLPRQTRPAEELIAAVIAAGGRLIVQRDRTGHGEYERFIRAAQRHGKVPAGKRLTGKALPWPDMEIRLEEAVSGSDPDLLPVPVPEKVGRYHPVVVRFRDQSDRHEVSKAVLPRALRLLHALVTEAERRGYQVANAPGRRTSYGRDDWTGARDGHITITINGHEHALRLLEIGLPSRTHWGRTHYHSRERYPQSGSGDLSIEICGYSGREGRQMRWADRKKWTLDDKLPDVLREVEIRAAEDEHRAREAERAAAQRRQQWEAAIAQAKQALIEAHRAEHLHQQVENWRQARHLRDYVAAMKLTVETNPPIDKQAALDWIAWAEAHVADLDPLATPLAMPEPPEATPDALQPFLKGWSPYGPDRSLYRF